MDTTNKKAIQDLLAVLNFIFTPNNFPMHEHLQHAFNGEGVHFQVFYQPERNEWTIGVLMRNTEYNNEYDSLNTSLDTPPSLFINYNGDLTFTSQATDFYSCLYSLPQIRFWQFDVGRMNADEIIEDVVARMHKYDFNTHSVVELFEHTLNRHLHRCFDPKIKAMRQRNHETIATLVAQGEAETEHVKTRLLAFLSEHEHDHWGFDPEKHSNLGKALISYLQYNPMDLPVLSRRSKEKPPWDEWFIDAKHAGYGNLTLTFIIRSLPGNEENGGEHTITIPISIPNWDKHIEAINIPD